jgi:hypothetical protein
MPIGCLGQIKMSTLIFAAKDRHVGEVGPLKNNLPYSNSVLPSTYSNPATHRIAELHDPPLSFEDELPYRGGLGIKETKGRTTGPAFSHSST